MPIHLFLYFCCVFLFLSKLWFLHALTHTFYPTNKHTQIQQSNTNNINNIKVYISREETTKQNPMSFIHVQINIISSLYSVTTYTYGCCFLFMQLLSEKNCSFHSLCTHIIWCCSYLNSLDNSIVTFYYYLLSFLLFYYWCWFFIVWSDFYYYTTLYFDRNILIK